MELRLNQKINNDLAWFIGFFKGDGYFTYGRVGIDTTTPELVEIISNSLTELSKKEVKLEAYGSLEQFKSFLPNNFNFLQYPKRDENRSTYVKIRVDSVEFAKTFNSLVNDFMKNIESLDKNIQLKFLQGVFDAESTVTPDATIQIDASKENRNLIEITSIILTKFQIKNQFKEYKNKVRLTVYGRTRNLNNLIEFQEKVNFTSKIKSYELNELIKIYRKPRDIRTKNEIKNSVLEILQKEKQIGMKSLMIKLQVKYDFLKRCLNCLIKDNKIKKFRIGKKVSIELVS